MTFFILEPEVAGGFGPDTILDQGVHPPRPIEFNYQFDGWLGDPLVETVANFIVTLRLKEKLEEHHASGIKFSDVKISKSSEFYDLYPDTVIPDFAWMQVHGLPGYDDFGLSSEYRLVASERMLGVLADEGLANCEMVPYAQL